MMSSKINVMDIVKGHLCTLCNADSKSVSFTDLFTFFLLPLLIAGSCVFFKFGITDSLTSLLVNFGAIFTALLLSVLVLVYDQGAKLSYKIELLQEEEKNVAPILNTRKALLNQLYYNICYAIVTSVALVVFCVLESVLRSKTFVVESLSSCVVDLSAWVLTPIVVFISLHLVLTILMILKRMHTILTTE